VGEREDVLADLRERAQYYASLTSLGLPPPARVSAPEGAASSERGPRGIEASSARTPTAIQGVPSAPSGRAASSASGLVSLSEGPTDLEGIKTWIGDCQRCKLAKGRKSIVYGQGNPNAELMFVGEGPGADEDEQGLAFVGRAGQLLTDIIEKGMKMRREDVYIANLIKCVRYNTLVLLADGRWERIGRLVRARYAGEVMSVADDGRLVPRRVVAWYATPLANRSVYRISHAASRIRGGNRAATWLTNDHPVLTRRGWVAAEDLGERDEIAISAGLSRVAHEVVTGSLLGDATIPSKNAHVQVTHCMAQEEYVHLKAAALAELAPVVRLGATTAKRGGEKHPTISCRTRASRALQVVRDRFYPDGGKKHVPKDLRLTPLVAAVWFLDDGHTRIKSDSLALSEIAAHSFLGDGIGNLVQSLRDDLGIEAHLAKASPGRIHFGSEASLRLAEMVAPYTPPSLRYKLHPRVRDRVAFAPSLYAPGHPEVLFDRVIVDKSAFKGRDRTFFCIDVESTHNFVTSGGVVHNCRPPQNRNPEPDEVLACQPFLERQIEVIRPKVLVGLGKFGGQWLLKTAEPISRIRGRVGEYRGSKVVPTWHPAYLLRNPDAKKDVWEDMKLVLRLLREE
jgi:uracil-DNA glycosylase family 4